MVKEMVTLDKDNIRFGLSIANIVGLIGAIAWAVTWKAQVDQAVQQEKVSPIDFAVLKTDVSYIKSELGTIRALLEKKG